LVVPHAILGHEGQPVNSRSCEAPDAHRPGRRSGLAGQLALLDHL